MALYSSRGKTDNSIVEGVQQALHRTSFYGFERGIRMNNGASGRIQRPIGQCNVDDMLTFRYQSSKRLVPVEPGMVT